jgi:hypothetical protein
MAERIRNLQPGEASYSNSLKRPTSARTLASLVKTLAELKRMRRESEDKKNDADDDSDQSAGDASERGGDEPPHELAELCAELARRLERLRGAGPAE